MNLSHWFGENMKNKITIIAVFFLCINNIIADVNKLNKIAVPARVGFKVEKVLYHYSESSNFQGDGFTAYIVRVDGESLKRFIKENVPISTLSVENSWTHGSLQSYARYLKIFEWLEECMEGKKVKDKINKVYSLKKIKELQVIYHLSVTEWQSNGSQIEGILTNATMYIIVPKDNIVMMFNQDT